MIDTEPAPHLIKVLKPGLENKTDTLRGLTEKLGGRYDIHHDTYYNLAASGALKAPQIHDLLATLVADEVGLYSNPILHDGKLYIVHVTEIEVPDATEFSMRQTEWRSRKAADPKLRLVNAWLQNTMPRMTTLNIDPIQTKYGILQPNGSIR